MASRRNPKFHRAQAKDKARREAAQRGWETRRRNASQKGAPASAPDVARAPAFSADSVDAVRKSLLSGFRAAQIAATRNGLSGLRDIFMQAADAAHARQMTRLIADYDFLSKRLPPVR